MLFVGVVLQIVILFTVCSTPKKQRTTKQKIAKQAGLTMTEMSPQKQSLIQMAHQNFQKAIGARRKLQMRLRKATNIINNARNPAQHLARLGMSSGAREILAGELRNFGKHPNARTWTTREKLFYYGIYKSSPKTFRMMKKQLTTPCEKTVKDVMSAVKLEPGISEFLFKVLQKKMEQFNEQDRACVLLFDEISINMNLYYNPKTDRVEGFENYGQGGGTAREADKMLVLMLRGLNSNWKLPIAFYSVHGTCPSDVIANLIPDIIRECKKINIPVICSVSDQGPTNRGAINSLRSKCSEGEFDPVYEVDGSKIVHLYDTPHLLKSLRNNLLTSDLEMEPGKIAKWAHIIEFFKLDEGLCKTSKLTYAHLCPLGRNKMTVKLAGRVFSETTGYGMKTFHILSNGTKLRGCEPTIELILAIDKLYDSTNGPG